MKLKSIKQQMNEQFYWSQKSFKTFIFNKSLDFDLILIINGFIDWSHRKRTTN